MQYELYPGSPGSNFLRQVVHGRPQATVDNHRISTLPGQLKGPQEFRAVVANGGLPLYRQANVFELLTHITKIGVDDFAGQYLVTCTDDLDAHSTPHRMSI